ncbi:hypothetical protein [uncultured Prevotella sp.]|uniref:hypothetical protein n=1 Tax=uncultured Prevotella sp. TaxID=159272 RepID=UPI002803C3BD|nr:hypothetical protein [uncultured Prevotella sp.]
MKQIKMLVSACACNQKFALLVKAVVKNSSTASWPFSSSASASIIQSSSIIKDTI